MCPDYQLISLMTPNNWQGKLMGPIQTCLNCPDRTTCVQICERVKNIIPAEIQDTDFKYKFVQFNEGNLSHSNPGDVNPIEFEHSPEEIKKLGGSLDTIIPSSQRKLKSRFISFMKCDTITNVAKRANVTKQSIQKQFQRIIRDMQRRYSGEDHQKRKPATPKQFKITYNIR